MKINILLSLDPIDEISSPLSKYRSSIPNSPSSGNSKISGKVLDSGFKLAVKRA
jgi:hypothetical protein